MLAVLGWGIVIMKDLHARKPVNKTAATVTSRGVHYDPDKIVQTNDSDLPIATRPFTKEELKQKSFVDLTGRRVGRFSVIGAARDFKGRWVVRCDCGTYSTRRAKSIKNPENVQDRCEHCRHLAFLKRNELWRRTGKHYDIRDF